MAATAHSEGSSRRSVMLSLYSVQFLTMAATSTLNPIIILYVAKTLGASTGFAAVVAALFSLVSLPVQIPIGILSDRIGRGRLLYIGSIVGVLGPLFCYFSPNLTIFIVARLFHGFSQALMVPTIWALTMDLAPAGGSGKAIGNIGAALQLGISLGPFVGGIVASAYGLQPVFLLCAALAAPNLVLAHLAARRIGRLPRGTASKVAAPAKGRIAWRNFIAALLVPSLASTASGAFITLFPAYAYQSKGIPLSLVGTILAASAIGQVFVRAFLASVSDKYGRKIVVLVGFLITGSMAYLVSQAGEFYSFLAISVTFGLGYSLVIPAGAALVRDSIPSNRQGMGMGSYQTFLALGSTIGLSGMGFLAGAVGFSPMFVVVSVIQFCSAGVLALAIKGPPRDVQNAP